jgi:type IV pilus assembly protein PilP
MKRYRVIICNLVCLTCLFLLPQGCDSKSEAPATPKVVRKKIVAQANTKAARTKAKNVRIPKTQKAVKRVPPKASTPVAVARQDSSATVQKSQTPAAAPRQAALEPKSAISKTQKPAQNDKVPLRSTAASGSQSKSAGKLVATAAPEVQKGQSSDGSPPMYNPKGKINPFEPLFKDQKAVVKKKKKKRRRPQTPLEKVDISQLKLVGIILAKSGNRALVEEASGKGYVIKKGTYIGINSGKVVEIKIEKVIVEEEFDDVFGKTKIRKREMKLPKPPGEL